MKAILAKPMVPYERFRGLTPEVDNSLEISR
jgi:hypothetical protein